MRNVNFLGVLVPLVCLTACVPPLPHAERPFGETMLAVNGRSSLYRDVDEISGLLPIARTLEYVYDAEDQRLSGTFILGLGGDDESSTQEIAAATQMQIIPADGPVQHCVPNVVEHISDDTTLWFFDCAFLSETVPEIVEVTISFNTTAGTVLTSSGQIRLNGR